MRKTSWYTCKNSGKRGYRTRDEAERALGSCRERRQNLRRRVPRVLRQERRAYYCDWCDGYHLTSQEVAA